MNTKIVTGLFSLLFFATSSFAASLLIDCEVVNITSYNPLDEALSPGEDYSTVTVNKNGKAAQLGGFYLKTSQADEITILPRTADSQTVVVQRDGWDQEYFINVSLVNGPRDGRFWGKVSFRKIGTRMMPSKFATLICKEVP
jgi:hypothetical protein